LKAEKGSNLQSTINYASREAGEGGSTTTSGDASEFQTRESKED